MQGASSSTAKALQETPVVDVRQVVFSYSDRRVLDGLSLQIPPRAIFGLLGANGAGKTTLIRLLVGILKPRSGSVRVPGEANVVVPPAGTSGWPERCHSA